jgi:hypothetical protein
MNTYILWLYAHHPAVLAVYGAIFAAALALALVISIHTGAWRRQS